MEQEKNQYQIHFERSINEETREAYWEQQAKEFVDWYKFPKTILDKSNQNKAFWRWYADGELNICHNAIDRHLKDQADKPALHYYSAYTKQERTYTWQELYDNVARLAYVYKKLGAKKGDRIIIYMPMIPEAVFAMLASARIGAIHSVVFGGFAAKELASRINDAEPVLIVSASCGYEPNKIIDYKSMLDEAIKISEHDKLKTIIVQRENNITKDLIIGRDFDYHSLMAVADHAPCEPVLATHPLYILYTSGTTGQPKGIVRDQGGCAMACQWMFKYVFDVKKGETYFSGSDIGWVVGHQYIVYGPLCTGVTTVLYEGKPTGTPDPAIYWHLVEKYKIKGIYTAPTALRAIRRDDLDGKFIKKYNISSLNCLSMAGERCDIPTYNWIREHLKVLINDNYWQTETGWGIASNYKYLHEFPWKAGSATKPVPGFNVKILDHDHKEITKPDVLGRICVKLPMPPNFMLTLYKNDQAYLDKYMNHSYGYYQTGDCGYFDEDGYLNIMTRLDDIINTAGHRLSTAQMEEVLVSHPDIVEAAVVAKVDELKGEIPVGFVVCKIGHNPEAKKLEKECITLIRRDIGPVASFYHCIMVDKLPKTRSGKTLRGTLKKIVDMEPITKIPPTIEDASVLDKIAQKVKEYGLHHVDLEYRDKVDKVVGSLEEILSDDDDRNEKN